MVSLIPSERDEDKEKFVQGIEKFLDTMKGKRYHAIFLATPVSKDVLSQRKHGYEGLYSALSIHSKMSFSYGTNKTTAINKSVSDTFTKTVGKSISDTNSHSTSNSTSSTSGVGFSSRCK